MVQVWGMNNSYKKNPAVQGMRRFSLLPPLIHDNLRAASTVLFYLVDVGGELIGVTRPNPILDGTFSDISAGTVRVLKLENGKRWAQVKDLGNCCLFLGNGETVNRRQ